MLKQSLLGFEWSFLYVDYKSSLGISQKFNIPSAIADVISCKNLPLDEVENFLSPSLKKLLPNPNSAMLDIGLAAERLKRAVLNKENVVIFGDYDVDGATSSAIFKRYLKMAGLDVKIYIPDRIKEGYGPNTNALLEIKKNGADLVITVDCGTIAFEPIKKAIEAGLDVIVVDHHIGVKEVPQGAIVINPNRYDETSDYTYLCGAGVSFLVITALNMNLKNSNYFASNNLIEPNLLSLTDLVALGTICDVMPLTALNRAFVKTGIAVMKTGTNLGIKTLLSICGNEKEITEFTLGFVIGPRINAGGRIGRSDIGANLLSTENPEEAVSLAIELDNLNAKRKVFEEEMLIFALKKIEEEKKFENNIIFVKDDSFHQGIIGILASRIKEKYNRPVAVFAKAEGYLKASLRSIENIDLGAIIHLAFKEGLIIAGGGHKMAGGLSVLEENYKKLEDFFNNSLAHNTFSKKILNINAKLTIGSLDIKFFEDFQKLSPFGNANQKPIFLLQNLSVIKVDVVKERHINLILKDEISLKTIKAMFFKAFDLGIMQDVLKLKGKKVDCVCEATLNEWNSIKRPELFLIDIAF